MERVEILFFDLNLILFSRNLAEIPILFTVPHSTLQHTPAEKKPVNVQYGKEERKKWIEK